MERVEWALFSGWDAVSEHDKFVESDGFKECGVIKDWVAGFEVRHAERLQLS
jgi:hypothetical protein